MVPEGWVVKQLGKIAEFQRGFDLPASKRIDGTIPIISSGGISGFHHVAKVKAPGIVTGRYGSIGEVFYVEDDFWPLNTSLWVKNFHGNHPKYLYYLLSNFDFKKFSDKTGVPGINRNDLHSVNIKIPPIHEQTKIAQILSTWDKAITTTEKLLSNNQQQKKALMQQLLTGNKRFPGFNKEWKTEKFKDIVNIEIGGTPSRSTAEYWDDQKLTQNRWLSIADLKQSKIYDSTEYISDLGVKNSNVSLIPAGTIVMSFKLTIGRKAILMKGCYTNEAICSLQIKDNTSLNNDFLFQAIELVDFNAEIDQAVKGKTLNKGKLHRLKIKISKDILEQQKIASVFSKADHAIEILQQKLDYLKQEKKALMQQLLTGKRRVHTARDSKFETLRSVILRESEESSTCI